MTQGAMTQDIQQFAKLVVRCLALVALLGACNPSKPDDKSSESKPSKPSTADASASADAALSSPHDFVLHEWGLLYHGKTSGSALRSGCSSKPTEAGLGLSGGGDGAGGGSGQAAIVGKPVIYLHPGDQFEHSTRITLTVGMPGATLREVWPTPGLGAQPPHGEDFTWKNIELLDKTCLALTAPTHAHPACQGLDDGMGCEAAELPKWIHTPESCMRVEDIETPTLLYNANASLRPTLLLEGELVSNPGEHSYVKVWVSRAEDLFYFEELAAGSKATLESGTRVKLDPELGFSAELAPKLAELGLSASESKSFLLAWKELLQGTPSWRFFAFASTEAIDQVLPLSVEPKPASRVRVLAVVIE